MHFKRSFIGKHNGKQSGYFKVAHCVSNFLHVFVSLEKAISFCSCPWFLLTLIVNARGAAKHYLRSAGYPGYYPGYTLAQSPASSCWHWDALEDCGEQGADLCQAARAWLDPGRICARPGAVCSCRHSLAQRAPFLRILQEDTHRRRYQIQVLCPCYQGLTQPPCYSSAASPSAAPAWNRSSAPHAKPSPAIVRSKSSPSRRRVRLPSWSPPSTLSSRGTQRACSRFRRKGKSLKRCSQMESNTDTAPSHFCSCCLHGPLRRDWSHVVAAPAMGEWLQFLTKHLSATKTCTGYRNALKSLKKYAASLDRRKEFVSICLWNRALSAYICFGVFYVTAFWICFSVVLDNYEDL